MNKEQIDNLETMIQFFKDSECLVGMTRAQAVNIANGMIEALESLKPEEDLK